MYIVYISVWMLGSGSKYVIYTLQSIYGLSSLGLLLHFISSNNGYLWLNRALTLTKNPPKFLNPQIFLHKRHLVEDNFFLPNKLVASSLWFYWASLAFGGCQNGGWVPMWLLYYNLSFYKPCSNLA